MNNENHPEAPLPHNDGAKTERIDLGLALLSAAAPPRTMLSPADIAAWCGCTPAMISSIEARALRRMREKVRAQFRLSPSDMADRRRFLALHFQS
jgi:transposase